MLMIMIGNLLMAISSVAGGVLVIQTCLDEHMVCRAEKACDKAPELCRLLYESEEYSERSLLRTRNILWVTGIIIMLTGVIAGKTLLQASGAFNIAWLLIEYYICILAAGFICFFAGPEISKKHAVIRKKLKEVTGDQN